MTARGLTAMAALAFVLRAAPLLLAQGPVLPASAGVEWLVPEEAV